jgi:hypothetical protein
MDLFGSLCVSSLGGKILHLLLLKIILDLNEFYFFFTRMKQFKFSQGFFQNEKDCFISKIKSDHGREFDNLAFKNSSNHELSTPETQQ